MESPTAIFEEAMKIQESLYQISEALNGVDRIREELYKKYLGLLRKAANMGHATAQFELGQTYEDINYWGINLKYNPKKCIFWYKKACIKGNGSACNALAHFYETGTGVKKDLNRALELYKKSMNLGDELGTENYKLLLEELDRKED